MALITAGMPPRDPSEWKRPLSEAEHRQRRQAAVKHGLFARSRPELKTRNYRAGRLLSKLQELVATEGEPLRASQLWAARAFCEHETMAADLYSAIQKTGPKALISKLAEQYLKVRRAQLMYGRELGLTPVGLAALSESLTGVMGAKVALAERAQAAQRRLRASHEADVLDGESSEPAE